MGPIDRLMIAALTLAAAPLASAAAEALTGDPPAQPAVPAPGTPPPWRSGGGAFETAGVRYLQLDPRVVAITRRDAVELELAGLASGAEAPLELALTGLLAGLPPLELWREPQLGPGAARASVPRAELALWDQLVVTWSRTSPGGTPEGGVLARLAGAAPGPLAAEPFPVGGAQAAEPKAEGYFLTFHCPEQEGATAAAGATGGTAGKGGCTVTYGFFSPASGKLTEGEIELEPGESVSLSALLVVYATCSGCA